MDQEKIGKFIKNLRKKNNLTQKELADKLGVTYQAVSKWENGKNIPDVAILKQISEDFSINIDEILLGEKKERIVNENRKLIISIAVFIIVLILILAFIIYNQHDTEYQFKTLSTSCSEFNITGSAVYNKEKSSIYISNINYCGGDDSTEYRNIECSLYEAIGNNEIKIKSCTDKKISNITLDNYLKDIKFNVNNYEASCKNFKHAKLYLRIEATDKNNKITTYKIPLLMKENCS